ncbi:MAG: hypothetical protein ACI8Z1_003374 [Candidatus Azotimanducaceae bacterium]|jgi:hypothetical protein
MKFKNTIALIVPCMLISFGSLADEHYSQDGTKFKTTDNSASAQLCMAALESREAIRVKAKELNVNRRDQKNVVCNEMSLVQFAKMHRSDIREWSIATVQ